MKTYAMGLKFTRYSRKHKTIETIIDIHTTKNNAGEIVKTRYVTEHDFLGQKVFDYEVLAVTIARSL